MERGKPSRRAVEELSDAFLAQFSDADLSESYLEHYGVKGMKWGVIRDRVNGIRKSPAAKAVSSSADHKRAAAVRTKAKVTGVNTLSNKDLQDLITRMNLERQYVTLKQVEHDQSLIGKGKAWTGKVLTNALTDALASWLKRPGSQASGRTSSHVRSWTTGQDFARTLEGTVIKKAIGS